MTSMKCPGCGNEMTVASIGGVEIDRCKTCGGIVLDKGEQDDLEALGVSHVVDGGMIATHQHRTTSAHCHACNKDMVALRGAGDVEYDWCDGCERLFFDAGELTALASFSDA
jgi:Zn-finger nucleic acid-binding protein